MAINCFEELRLAWCQPTVQCFYFDLWLWLQSFSSITSTRSSKLSQLATKQDSTTAATITSPISSSWGYSSSCASITSSASRYEKSFSPKKSMCSIGSPTTASPIPTSYSSESSPMQTDRSLKRTHASESADVKCPNTRYSFNLNKIEYFGKYNSRS